MAEKEGVHEGIWQREDLDKWYQTSPFDLPERCPRKVFAPEDLPARNGPSIGAEASGQFAHTTRCWPLPHGADHNDDRAQVHLGAEKAYRRRRRPLPTAITIAAEAQSKALWLG